MRPGQAGTGRPSRPQEALVTTPRPFARSLRVLAVALAAGTLLATAACSGADDSAPSASETSATVAERGLAAQTTSPGSTPASPSPGEELTGTGARNALITPADIEGDWTQVDNPQEWRDSLLVGNVDVAAFLEGQGDPADCRRLVDALYDETLLGRPSGASALTGFQEGDSRLLYQVAAYDKAGLDDSMEWLHSLPDTCDQFTLTGGDDGDRTVQVIDLSLPDAGDDRQGLTVTVKGTSNGSPVTLSLDVAVVRIGTSAITVTNGGLDGVDHDTTSAAVEQGTERLQEVLAGRTPQPTPSGIN
ncbi:lipoprotein [Streptomyces malachitofuscus]|nr:lipoprotein [Streptomyces malachitofuscus]